MGSWGLGTVRPLDVQAEGKVGSLPLLGWDWDTGFSCSLLSGKTGLGLEVWVAVSVPPLLSCVTWVESHPLCAVCGNVGQTHGRLREGSGEGPPHFPSLPVVRRGLQREVSFHQGAALPEKKKFIKYVISRCTSSSNNQWVGLGSVC